MLEEDIQAILSYCSFRIDYFYVSRTFERIYTELIYDSELSDKLFLIAAYEQDQVSIDMLKDRNLILFEENKRQKLIDYWKENKVTEPINIDLKSIACDYIYSYRDIILSTAPKNHYSNRPIDKQDLKFATRLLDQFDRLSKRFFGGSYYGSYNKYQIRRGFMSTQYRNVTYLMFLDYENNYYLIFVIVDETSISTMCNKFTSFFTTDSFNHYRQISEYVTDDYISTGYACLELTSKISFTYINDYPDD